MDRKPGRWVSVADNFMSSSTHSLIPCHLFDSCHFALQPSVGQVARVDVSSKVEVVWADNSKTIILPQVRLARPPPLTIYSLVSLLVATPEGSSPAFPRKSQGQETDFLNLPAV